ncbi:cysteine--tRNA ligase [Moraxella caviae]|uniref:Cysteine--tRNA ligase n=1 Tax=Moraxella caviae TaxID=34060 RepID=A0A1S9ZX59_9GAMM|nr:cysteine--tRNA ligase [Moraxella caviae]OOR87531.1 cysteine--tRNA ligase [Moraxella caviae]STZ10064.1 Cysteine--tRNA ligase [Moraxella caviae]VEW12745.1 Cysteine--tRNA ligase [Moraxella caviae]
MTLFAAHQADLSLYNTMTAAKTKFTPIHAGKVGMYVCGMTVYDYCHIGHARVMVAFDVIYRHLLALGFDVTYVRNITDIDDKIIARANENGESIGDLTARFIAAMHEDADNLGCLRPSQEPKATEHITQMQTLIGTLMDKNHAYTKGGDVYYAVDSFAEYGKLSKRNLDEMQAGNRVDVADDKSNPFDFVLWKRAKAGEPAWASPWGEGRPGWHIECSAMSGCCLGESFDIHGGGHDLQFPHHENEIAQSEAATGKTYANNWLHVGFINVDGEKMSKSLGNFSTIKDVLANFHGETVRFFILSSHYRSQVNFSDAALTEAHTALSRLYHALKSAESLAAEQSGVIGIDAGIVQADFAKAFADDFVAAMNDDFNTPKAVSVLFSVASEINKAIKANDTEAALNFATLLKTLASVLGLLGVPASEFLQKSLGDEGLSAEEIEALIAKRADAKKNKDFALADQIREELKAQGVELEDSRQGTTWRRV